MEIVDINSLLTINEQSLNQLFQGKGKVHIRIDNFGKYYVPFVLFAEPDAGKIIPQGIIVRNDCIFAAKTKEAILSVVRDITEDAVMHEIDPSE
ncbi:MAG TPA: hypothetical protein VNX68_19750 [Nitrosopumilaceae archaeon]|jgi:hypothetical protein|nr:hypothetical protein [Nitrosopumilaceae archaeon]